MAKEKKSRRWSRSEDDKLFNYVRVYPHNLHMCFMNVADILGRTPGAVENRWYTKVSKDPKYLAFFTASQVHVSRNRKNGMGVKTSKSLWDRIVKLLNAAKIW